MKKLIYLLMAGVLFCNFIQVSVFATSDILDNIITSSEHTYSLYTTFGESSYYIDETTNKLYRINNNVTEPVIQEYSVFDIYQINNVLYASTMNPEGKLEIVIVDNSNVGRSFLGISNSQTNDNESTIYNFLINTMGLNEAGACGVLANIYSESGFNPNALGDNGTSYGICQWHDTSTGVGRWSKLKNYCSNNGYDYTTIIGQLWYMKYELENSYTSTLNYIKSVSNDSSGSYNAAYRWCYYFEVPANKETVSVTRGNLAKNTYWPKYATPSSPVLTISKTPLAINESVTFNWNSVAYATQYNIGIFKDGASVDFQQLGSATTYTKSFTAPGNYAVHVSAINGTTSKFSDSNTVYFHILYPNVVPSITTTENSISLSWSCNPAPSSVDLYYRESSASEDTTRTINLTPSGTNFSTTINGLKSNTSYTIQIDAKGFVGVEDKQYRNVNIMTKASDTTVPTITSFTVLTSATAGSNVTITGSATDNVAVTKMELFIDDVLKTTSTNGSISYTWVALAGAHTAYIRAYDAKGYAADSSKKTINVSTPVTSVTVSPSTLTLNTGGTSQLTATVSPSTATNKAVIWSSSNTSIATVNSNGLVTALSDGNATITVTTVDGGKTATCSVTVAPATVPVTGVTISPSTLTLNTGATSQLTATVSPSTATNKTVTWSSNNTAVATVNSTTGLVTAVSAGNVTITATTADGGKISTCSVSVVPVTTQLIGDVDGSGTVTSQDALKILYFVVGKITLTPQQLIVADTNKDSNVNSQDALRILYYVVGKIESL